MLFYTSFVVIIHLPGRYILNNSIFFFSVTLDTIFVEQVRAVGQYMARMEKTS